VVLVDDVDDVRYLLRTALGCRGGFDVVAEASDGREAIAAAANHQPDVVVLDLGLPDLAGQEVLSGIRAEAPDTRVVVFTGNDSPPADLRQEVDGFVLKGAEVDYLVDLLEDLGRAAPYSASLQLAGRLDGAPVARKFATARCRDWHCTGVVDDAALVVSELVTNAVTHAQSSCELRLRLSGGVLRIEVADAGKGTPDPLAPDAGDEHGRGLLIVSALSTAWGVQNGLDGRKIVWAELAASR